MRGLVIGLGLLAASLAGCAREPQLGFSRLGAQNLAAETTAAEVADVAETATTERAMRHVTSNKVLGAMAFQKVTGRTVDPSRLTGER